MRSYFNKKGLRLFPAFLFMFAVMLSIQPVLSASGCDINWHDEKQFIDGFGASGAFHQIGSLMSFPEHERSLVLDLLFSQERGIGLSIVRNIVGDGGDWGDRDDGPTPSIEPEEGVWNWTGDEEQIWLMNEAKKRGCTRFMSTVWSPPAWMKTNNSVINGGELREDKYQAFAEYLANYVKGYKRYHNLDIYAISPANEPDFTAPYSSCRWTGRQLANFIKNNLMPVFKREGITAKVVMPEMMNFSEEYALDTLNDPEAVQGVDIIGTHAYDYGVKKFPASKSKNKSIWQTEVSIIGDVSDVGMADALRFAKLIHGHLTYSEVNAWNFWWLVSNKKTEGGSLLNLVPDGQTVKTFKRLYAMGNFSRFIRPGWVSIDFQPTPSDLTYASAYKDKTTGKFAIVVINNGDSDQIVKFNLNGFPATRSVTPYRTSDSENLAMLEAIKVNGKTFTAVIKSKSVTTFAGPPRAILPGVLSFKEACSQIEAENFDGKSRHGFFGLPDQKITYPAGDEGTVVGGIKYGSFLEYKNVNFGTGVTGFTARVFSSGVNVIELRLDDPEGILIGTCPVKGSSGWSTVSGPVEKTMGFHNLYLVFKGDDPSFRLNWFAFTSPPSRKPAAGENLVANPGFEKGTVDGWYSFGAGAIAAVDHQAQEGKYSALVTGRTDTWQGIAQGLLNNMETGLTYDVSAWVRLQNKSSAIVKLTFKRTDDEGVHYESCAARKVNDASWTQIAGRYTVRSKGILSGLDLYLEGPPAGVNFYLDNVSVKIRPAPQQ